MLGHVLKVLGDIKRVYPAYDAKAGYELAGFVWFQGWNDMVDSGTYPTRGQPGSYDAYSKTSRTSSATWARPRGAQAAVRHRRDGCGRSDC